MPLIEAINIGKVYPGGVVANDGVNLSVEKGEVHAVVGENGAGKSTLMKILFGIEQPDAGQILLDGKPVRFSSPRDAIDAGIGMVFQHFSLVPSFSVYENVALGSEPRNGIRFDREAAIAKVRELSEKFRLHVDPLPPVRSPARSASSSASKSSRRSIATPAFSSSTSRRPCWRRRKSPSSSSPSARWSSRAVP